MTDVAAWQESVDNSQAQLEHQSLRILNLELMSEYGAVSWRSYNSVLTNMIDQAQKHLQVTYTLFLYYYFVSKSKVLFTGRTQKKCCTVL